MRDYQPLGKKKCYACIQWDGNRNLEDKTKGIQVDIQSEGTCRVTHKKVRGTYTCNLFFPLK